jgi:hypothetical protein
MADMQTMRELLSQEELEALLSEPPFDGFQRRNPKADSGSPCQPSENPGESDGLEKLRSPHEVENP